MKAEHILWRALTPVRVGAGQEGSGVVDLPVFRESATGFPALPSSSLKGVLRAEVAATDSTLASDLFGKPTTDQALGGGDLLVYDATILAIPIRSMWGVFALVTCPLVLQRLRDQLQRHGFDHTDLATDHFAQEQATRADTAPLGRDGRVLLDDFILPCVAHDLSGLVDFLAGDDKSTRELFQHHLCVVPDDVFAYLARNRLPVAPHIQIDPDTGTVARGALWYEEALPENTILTSLLIGQQRRASEALSGSAILQIGGRRTVGRGLMSAHVRAGREGA